MYASEPPLHSVAWAQGAGRNVAMPHSHSTALGSWYHCPLHPLLRSSYRGIVLVRGDLKGHHPAPSQGQCPWHSAQGCAPSSGPAAAMGWYSQLHKPLCSGRRSRVFPEHLKAAAASKAQRLLELGAGARLLGSPPRAAPARRAAVHFLSADPKPRLFPPASSQSVYLWSYFICQMLYPCRGSPSTQCFLIYPLIVTSQSDLLFSHDQTGMDPWQYKLSCLRKREETRFTSFNCTLCSLRQA